MVKGFVRCGICDQDFQSTEEWDKHAKGERHQKLIAIWRVLELEAIPKDEPVPREVVQFT